MESRQDTGCPTGPKRRSGTTVPETSRMPPIPTARPAAPEKQSLQTCAAGRKGDIEREDPVPEPDVTRLIPTPSFHCTRGQGDA